MREMYKYEVDEALEFFNVHPLDCCDHELLTLTTFIPHSYSRFCAFTCCLSLMMVLASCQRKSIEFEPNIYYIPTVTYLEYRPSAFPRVTKEEAKQEWSKEYRLGIGFAEELDLYRAITCFKRSSYLMPASLPERRDQIDFCLMQSYYFASKYSDTLNIFNKSNLREVPAEFPAFRELLIMLYDCYQKNDECDKANKIRGLIVENDYQLADDLVLYEVLSEGDLCSLVNLLPSSRKRERLQCFIEDFGADAKSVRKARLLNALLPGAGYYYVGLTKSALTSFLINTVFIAAAYQFFHKGYVAAGVITTSLEFGWYFGGINGAGLAANEYNEHLYEGKARDFMTQECFFLF